MGAKTLNDIFYKPDIGASGAVEKGKFDDGLDVADGLIEGNKPANNKLSAFAATTSEELAGVISDKIGGGALVFASLVISGDGTAGRVLRALILIIEDGTNADTLKCTTTSSFNGDVIGVTDNIAKNATTGSFSLSAAGNALTVELADVTGILSASKILDDTALTFMIYPTFNGSDIVITAYNGLTPVKLTAIAPGKTLMILITYVTSG